MMHELRNLIGGELTAPAAGQYLDDHEPATGRVHARAPDSDLEDLAHAVDAARSALPAWRDLAAESRARLLLRLSALLDEHADALSRDESIDTGKPLSLASSLDIPRAAANLRFFAAAASQFHSESHATDARTVNFTLRQPIGLVACISPWNLPLYLFTWKIAPALAAGNCVIAKPPELAPLTAWRFCELCRQAGLPAGVLNVLHGQGRRIGRQIVEHPAIQAISFTGGTATGAEIAAAAAPRFCKLSLELGGKNPSLVFADSDFDRALEGSLRAAFTNQGQVCLCGSRILVERPLYERFRDAFVARAAALEVGDPLEARTQQGAVISEAHLQKVLGCIETARREGGQILCGGSRVHPPGERCRDGWFIAPTVIEGLSAQCTANQDEIFGPVVTLMPFDDEDEAIALANSTRYGLAASIWSRDVDRCHRTAQRLEAGMVWINCWMVRDLRTPMGGTKHSGVGREGGFEAMRFFTEPKNVCMHYA